MDNETQRVINVASHVVKVATNLLYKDPHRWSARPCQTCKAMTELLGFDFGCERYRKEKQE